MEKVFIIIRVEIDTKENLRMIMEKEMGYFSMRIMKDMKGYLAKENL